MAFSTQGIFRTHGRHARWTSRNRGLPIGGVLGPDEDPLSVTTLAIDPKRPRTMYAGTSCGIFHTRNGGARWRRVGSPGLLADSRFCVYVTMITIDPSTPATLYAAYTSYEDLLLRSTDRGRTWTVLAEEPREVWAFAIDPTDSRTLYVGSYDFLPQRSSDGGATWENVGTGLVYGRAERFVVTPDRTVYLAIGGTSRGSSNGFFRSRDQGRTWDDLSYRSDLSDPSDPASWLSPVQSIASDAAGTLFVGTSDEGVLRRDDATRGWVGAYPGLPGDQAGSCRGQRCMAVNALVAHPRKPGWLWAETDAGFDGPGRVFATHNGGLSWSDESTGLPRQ